MREANNRIHRILASLVCLLVLFGAIGASEVAAEGPLISKQTFRIGAILANLTEELSGMDRDETWLVQIRNGTSNREVLTHTWALVAADKAMFLNRISDPTVLPSLSDLVSRLPAARKAAAVQISLELSQIAVDDLAFLLSFGSEAGTPNPQKYMARLTEARNKHNNAGHHLHKDQFDQAMKQLTDAHTVVLETMGKMGFTYSLSNDADNDLLANLWELAYRTDPLNADTDRDGLLDGYEMNATATTPITVDSDSDGVLDGDEDPDGDTLSNRSEALLGSNPRAADTDADGADDRHEGSVHRTDLLTPDTDQDGLEDGAEIRLGTNPLNPDTNGNGILDGDELYAVTTRSEPAPGTKVAATVTMNVTGSSAMTTTITNVAGAHGALSRDIPGYLGAIYEFKTQATFDSATLTFTFQPSLAEGQTDFSPAIFYFNEAAGILEKLPNQTYLAGSYEIRAQVSHFSTYLLLNGAKWDEVWAKDFLPPRTDVSGEATYIDIVFSVDSSGSMTWNDPSGLRRNAAKNFVDKLAAQDRSAVVDFDSHARTLVNLTTDKGAVKIAIDRIDSSGGTNLYAGLNAAFDELIQNSTPDRLKYVIFLTDGDGFYSSSVLQKARDHKITVFTIGLGYGVNTTLLRQIAEATGGKYYFASQAGDLDDIFDNAAEETVSPFKDTDGDGIADYYETEGIRLSNGITVFLKYDDVDTDDDGISDGAELGAYVNNANGGYFTFRTRPDLPDTDEDQFKDGEDLRPLIYDVSDRTLMHFSDAVYVNLEKYRNNLIQGVPQSLFESRPLGENGRKSAIDDWYILNAEDSHWYDSGFGALAVMRRGKIILAFRGTEPTQVGDIAADLELAFLHYNHMIPMAKEFAAQIALKYPDAEVWVTGHSLGGFIGEKVSYDFVENKIHEAFSLLSWKKRARVKEIVGQPGYFRSGVTFNAPGVTANFALTADLMLDTIPQWAVNDAKYDAFIHNYVIDGDLVGNLGTHIGHDHVLDCRPADLGLLDRHYMSAFYPHF